MSRLACLFPIGYHRFLSGWVWDAYSLLWYLLWVTRSSWLLISSFAIFTNLSWFGSIRWFRGKLSFSGIHSLREEIGFGKVLKKFRIFVKLLYDLKNLLKALICSLIFDFILQYLIIISIFLQIYFYLYIITLTSINTLQSYMIISSLSD